MIVLPTLDVLFGSSPRVRGTREVNRNACGLRRFIPACAGNTVI